MAYAGFLLALRARATLAHFEARPCIYLPPTPFFLFVLFHPGSRTHVFGPEIKIKATNCRRRNLPNYGARNPYSLSTSGQEVTLLKFNHVLDRVLGESIFFVAVVVVDLL